MQSDWIYRVESFTREHRRGVGGVQKLPGGAWAHTLSFSHAILQHLWLRWTVTALTPHIVSQDCCGFLRTASLHFIFPQNAIRLCEIELVGSAWPVSLSLCELRADERSGGDYINWLWKVQTEGNWGEKKMWTWILGAVCLHLGRK